MSVYYDDNFGEWNIRDAEDVAFHKQVQKESKWKKCRGCGKRVKLRPQYDLCNSCCEKLERGVDLYA
jgi:rRNA maturation endonuclease Nob1